jgi:hypothetical protein
MASRCELLIHRAFIVDVYTTEGYGRTAADFIQGSKRMRNWRLSAQRVWPWIKIASVVIGVPLSALLLLYISSFLLGRTVWDVFKVLAVPIAVGAAVPLLNWLQKKRELDVADQRAQDDALQAYLGQMAQLMLLEEADEAKPDEAKSAFQNLLRLMRCEREADGVIRWFPSIRLRTPQPQIHERGYEMRSKPDEAKPKPLRKSVHGDDVRILARARTLTVLRRLRSGRKRSVLDFLYEAGLIQKPRPIIALGSPDQEYNAADLSGADLRGAVLRRADLSGPQNGANFSGADLRGADLTEANLSSVTLRDANLSRAQLCQADLSHADLSRAKLSEAHMSGAKLFWANLSRATGITDEALEQQTEVLQGPTMPNGQWYEHWLKDKEDKSEQLTARQKAHLEKYEEFLKETVDKHGGLTDRDNAYLEKYKDSLKSKGHGEDVENSGHK